MCVASVRTCKEQPGLTSSASDRARCRSRHPSLPGSITGMATVLPPWGDITRLPGRLLPPPPAALAVAAGAGVEGAAPAKEGEPQGGRGWEDSKQRTCIPSSNHTTTITITTINAIRHLALSGPPCASMFRVECAQTMCASDATASGVPEPAGVDADGPGVAAPAPFMAMPAPPLTTAASEGDTAEAAAAAAAEGVAAAPAALPLVAGLGTGGGCTGRDVLRRRRAHAQGSGHVNKHWRAAVSST
jgi:hypothetical protein